MKAALRTVRRWLCQRCPLQENYNGCERRKVSPEGRARYDVYRREAADVEERLRLVDIETKVIDHVMRREALPNPKSITHG